MNILKLSIAVVFLFYGNFYSKVSAKSHENDTVARFVFPLSCVYGETCWAVNYVDSEPSAEVKDFKCNRKSYDGHKGTDFALGSAVQMARGVNVLAARGGRVLRVRDGQNDRLKSAQDLERIKQERKECGNAVLIDHGNGLQSLYCHLKSGSITVKPQKKVKTGEIIGQVGQSGLAEFPHLHFGVIWEGGVMDPYTGALNTAGCGQIKTPMWIDSAAMPYEPVAIFDGGFRSMPPDFKAIQRGESHPDFVALNSAAFVFWGGFYNVEKGDEITLKITDPAGKVFISTEKIVPKTRALQYYFTGRKIGRVQLVSGTYTGHVRLRRVQGHARPLIRERAFTIRVK